MKKGEMWLVEFPSDAGQIEVKITPNLEKQIIKATFTSGCEFTVASADGLSKTCTVSDKETFKWISSEPEGFVYSYNK